jgi:hypothetical protein
MGTGEKRQRPQSDKRILRALSRKQLFLLFLRGKRSLGGLRLRGALLELVHATGGIHELLLTSVKWMAHVTDTDDDGRPGGAGLDHVAARATDFRFLIFRMNVGFHKRPHKLPWSELITSVNFHVFWCDFRSKPRMDGLLSATEALGRAKNAKENFAYGIINRKF